ncbi:hypothetical protein [Elizabethkingia anophelis]|uniref:Uncharacterized protein n=1 Tax=Elizabethkingia anophelis TaxID=1117645 RepID=A0A494JC69_9FLAO|nr:hypothetical protein [Elizabethkingia anophelis]AQX52432.1 hypothetical protein AYC66_17885 [Elizabethkingia anophelis]MDV3554548.1 hypothetical protein [Elizabethkingia anophelis]MDV3651769.1 hypothetical protein [Elizabethkingia anophelis]MDV3706655.1 hypothetical protein [Elizabethkingia anophelis]MDV3888465.1 hypothetical protein [Elizabethkingia anophelis]
MKKIMEVIENCTDCKFSREYQELNGNTSFVLICDYEKSYDDGAVEKNPFLIAQSSCKIRTYNSIPIPKECPLEDYNENNT